MTPTNPAPDAVEYINAHRSSSFLQYNPAPQVMDLQPGDTTTGISDTWAATGGGAGGNLEMRYHFFAAQEMHGLDLTFANTEGYALYAIEGSLDGVNYDVLVSPLLIPGIGSHRVRRNFDFPAKTYNFYAISVESAGADTSSTVTCTDCRLYSFFVPTASLTGTITVAPGQQANLAYVTEFAESVSIDNGVGQLILDTPGNVAVSPSITTTYTLTATSRYGVATSSVTITVAQPGVPTASLSADKSQILAGEGVVLTYKSTNASSASISPVIGTVPFDQTGQITVHPAATTTYVLSVDGPGGNITRQTIVTVGTGAVIGCMDQAATNYNSSATRDTTPSSCTYVTGLPQGTNRGHVRRPVVITVSAEIILASLQSDFSSPPSVSVALTADQKVSLGLTGGATVTSLQGLAFYSGAKLQVPTVDVTRYDPAACAARAPVRLDDDGTVTLFLVPGPLSAADEIKPELYPTSPTLKPYLVSGTWHVWALLVLSAYKW